MRQIALQLKTKMNNVNIMNNNIAVEKIILNSMLALFLALALWYVFILGNMVFNIVERKALEKESLTLSNEVSDMELSYLALSKSVDMTLSSSMGFKEIKATFATRKSLGSLKIANNEI
jgi:hypothetical protein